MLNGWEYVDEHSLPQNFGLNTIGDLGLIWSASTNRVVETDEDSPQNIWMEIPEWIKDYTLDLCDYCEQLETERPVGSKRFALATGCRSNTSEFVSLLPPRLFWSSWVSAFMTVFSVLPLQCRLNKLNKRQFNVSKNNCLMSLPKMYCKVNANGSWNNFTFLKMNHTSVQWGLQVQSGFPLKCVSQWRSCKKSTVLIFKMCFICSHQ